MCCCVHSKPWPRYSSSWLTGSFPELWLYALGALFIATTLFLPKGIAGLVTGWRRPTARAALPRPATAGRGAQG